jgi:hypothetical protein
MGVRHGGPYEENMRSTRKQEHSVGDASRPKPAVPAEPLPPVTDANRAALPRGARLLPSVAVAANLLPAALLFYFIHRFGIDVPWLDEWPHFVPLLQQLDQGTLKLSGLFDQVMEHRPVFPRLLTLANAALFHWNRTVEMYVTAALLVLCAWLLFRFVRAYWAHPLTPVLFLPMAWTLFSWRQWENLLWGFQTCFGLLAAGAVLAFCSLQRARKTDGFLLTAAAAAFVASFSTAGGLFLWPIGVAQLLLRRVCAEPADRPRTDVFGIWTIAGVLTWALFFTGHHAPPETGAWPTGFGYLIHNPVATARFLTTMIGSPLSWNQPTAQALGIVMTAAGAWAVLRLLPKTRDLAASAPLLSLMAFTVINAVLACDERMGINGTAQALNSRYCSLTMLGLVALYALLTRFAVTERRPATWIACAGMIALLLTGAVTNLVSWRDDPLSRWFLRMEMVGSQAVRYPDVVSDEAFSALLASPPMMRQQIPFLRSHKYTLFRRTAPEGVPARYGGSVGGCNIETVNERAGPVIDVHLHGDASGLRVIGWAVDLAEKRETGRLFISIDGRIDVPAVPGADRPDVAEYFKNRNYATAGFTSYVRTSLLTPGEHTLELKIVSHDDTSYQICGASSHIRVTE